MVFIFCYALSLIIIGPSVLSLISDTAHLLPRNMLVIFLISAFLEMNHSLCTSYLTTKIK